jgi:hypothetical protein
VSDPVYFGKVQKWFDSMEQLGNVYRSAIIRNYQILTDMAKASDSLPQLRTQGSDCMMQEIITHITNYRNNILNAHKRVFSGQDLGPIIEPNVLAPARVLNVSTASTPLPLPPQSIVVAAPAPSTPVVYATTTNPLPQEQTFIDDEPVAPVPTQQSTFYPSAPPAYQPPPRYVPSQYQSLPQEIPLEGGSRRNSHLRRVKKTKKKQHGFH